jgi:hypothetical protein
LQHIKAPRQHYTNLSKVRFASKLTATVASNNREDDISFVAIVEVRNKTGVEGNNIFSPLMRYEALIK